MTDCNSTDRIGSQFGGKKLSHAVEKCIERITQKEGIVAYNVNIHHKTTKEKTFTSGLQAINVKAKTENDEKEIHLFVKNRLLNKFAFDEFYKREAFFYNELMPIYDKLQDEAQIPDSKRFKVAKSYEESNSDVTVLEDLSKRGFRSKTCQEPMSLEFAKFSVMELAKLHALSFVVLHSKPEYYEKAIKPLKLLYTLDSDWDIYSDAVCDAAAASLDGDAKYRLQKFKPKIKEIYWRLLEGSDTIQSCLCHGDFRTNNIMSIEKNGGIKDLITVDFQLVHYGCPVKDFFYFIFSGSDQKFRKKHLDELKELYYETFKTFLQYFDIDSQDVYSKKRFEKEYQENLKYGLACFLILAPFLFYSEEGPELENGLLNVNVEFKNDISKERLRGVVDDFIQWGIL